MNTRKLILLLTAFLGLTAAAFAQTKATLATVAKVMGNATLTLADGSMAPLTAGTKVPQGATITTGADGEVYLESHAGYVSAIQKDTTVLVEEISVTSTGGKVTEEKTTLDLKSGNLVAMLDPRKKAVNNYQVRTPKGVAAARGTTFSVSFEGNEVTVAVVNGLVTITGSSYGTWDVGAGQITQTTGSSAASMSLADYVADGGIRAAFISELVAAVAVAAENNIGGTTSADLRAVADSVISAAPSLAAQIASTVQTFAPSQSQVITDSTAANAPAQSEAVRTAPPQITTPQVIDPSTVSRSN